jgi:hypothetical protein
VLTRHVAIVSETADLSVGSVIRVAAAIQKQVIRDFAPAWGVSATVSAFARLEDVPPDYWRILIVTAIDVAGLEGTHQDQNGQPYALVRLDSQWPSTASHECLEMLADPSGNRLVGGPSVQPEQGLVRYLVEVCDPLQGATNGYQVDGVMLADFYTPQYFESAPTPGVRYCVTGRITRPLQVLPGGYLSWLDSDGNWWQLRHFGAVPTITRLPPGAPSPTLRAMVDGATRDNVPSGPKKREAAWSDATLTSPTHTHLAVALRAEIEQRRIAVRRSPTSKGARRYRGRRS